jgi:hypothetical protein
MLKVDWQVAYAGADSGVPAFAAGAHDTVGA